MAAGRLADVLAVLPQTPQEWAQVVCMAVGPGHLASILEQCRQSVEDGDLTSELSMTIWTPAGKATLSFPPTDMMTFVSSVLLEWAEQFYGVQEQPEPKEQEDVTLPAPDGLPVN